MANTSQSVDFSDAREVVLVDSKDNRQGMMDIYQAHFGTGTLHRAISVLLHDGEGRVLLQRRSANKPLWPLHWSNTVCTHPKDRELYVNAAARRLDEEMGIKVEKEKLKELFRFEYRARYDEELSEHELDTVIVGKYLGEVEPDPKEVSGWKWMEWDDIQEDIYQNPDNYTPWFKLIADNDKVTRLFG